MIEILVDLLEQLVLAAIWEHEYHEVVHVGEPARYTLFRQAPCGHPGHGDHTSMILSHGQTMRINRGARLLVEPIDRVMLRPVHVLIEGWVTT